jgi:hypothetical protein
MMTLKAARRLQIETTRLRTMKLRVAVWWHKNHCENCQHGVNPLEVLLRGLEPPTEKPKTH